MKCFLLFSLALFSAANLTAQSLAQSAAMNSDWRTPAEISRYRTTPDYAETVAYLDRIAAADPGQVRIENFGKTGEGRDLKSSSSPKTASSIPPPSTPPAAPSCWFRTPSTPAKWTARTPAWRYSAISSHKKAQSASWIMSSSSSSPSITSTATSGARRTTASTRTAPSCAGWRGNATNLNLNRDYMKADAPETRAFLKMFHRWLPDFFVDDHVTDGMDYQYDVTFTIDDTPDVAPATAQWIHDTVTPELERQVNASRPSGLPHATSTSTTTPTPRRAWPSIANPPRFSTGQMILENRPGHAGRAAHAQGLQDAGHGQLRDLARAA